MEVSKEHIDSLAKVLAAKGWDKVRIESTDDHLYYGKVEQVFQEYFNSRKNNDNSFTISLEAAFNFSPVNMERTPLADPDVNIGWKNCRFNLQYDSNNGFVVQDQVLSDPQFSSKSDIVKKMGVGQDILEPKQCWNILMPFDQVPIKDRQLER